MRVIAFVVIVLVSPLVVSLVAIRRGRARRRAAKAEDVAFEWERARNGIAKLFEGGQNTTVVLITRFGVSSEAAGHSLHRALVARWSDRVEVVWQEDPPSDPHWEVVTTTETVLATPTLERQWLGRMRTVCDTYGCRVSSFGVCWGDSPPSQAGMAPDFV